MDTGGLLTVGQVMKRTGLSRKALRLYEQADLVVPATRTAAGYRLYDPASLPRLDLIRRARALNVGIRELGELLDIAEGASEHAQENLRSIVAQKLQDTATRIQELQALQQLLVNVEERLTQRVSPQAELVEHCGSLLCTCPTQPPTSGTAAQATSPLPAEIVSTGCGCGCAGRQPVGATAGREPAPAP